MQQVKFLSSSLVESVKELLSKYPNRYLEESTSD